MTSLPPLVLGTDESRQLQSRIRRELVRREWSEGDDDEVMAEYILVMLANNKTSAQIAGELDDLVGESSEGGAKDGGGVASFVEWLWLERSQIGKERSPAAANVSEVSHDHSKARRRSQSPDRRRGGSAAQRRHPAEASIRNQSDRWDETGRPSDIRREHPSRTPRVEGRQRELLSPSSRRNGKMASDDISKVNGNRRELFPTNGADAAHHAAMDNVEHNRDSQQRSLRIQGSGGDKIFQSSLERAQRDGAQLPAQGSIFSRVSMPDPRAQEFVPRGSSEAGLLSRLDPMIPVNELPSAAATADLNRHETAYPTEPQDTALCRYSLKCTNPMCAFSHPSVSAVSASKESGEEPLVLRREACRFQHGCTNADCPFSHVSPAVAFVLAKGVSQASAKTGPAPCHFQMDCKNPDCTYAHYDPATGLAQLPPASKSVEVNESKLDQALKSGSSNSSEARPCKFGARCTRVDCHFSHPAARTEAHVSDRLAQFGDSEMEGEMETIIPAV